MTNEEYITLHRTEDVRGLALQRAPEGVDLHWALQQIEGWQTATRKLPTWAQTEGVWFPPRLSMEQCSSELTALYKCQLVERLIAPEERHRMVDLTGGFGIDFSYLGQLFREAVYAERLPHLCEIARHNLPLLSLPHAEVAEGESEALLSRTGGYSLVFADPARRNGAGRKVVGISDCTPDVSQLCNALRQAAPWCLIKLSPMLDISLAMRQMEGISEVHVVSVKGECKELLLVVGRSEAEDITYHCVNLDTTDPAFISTRQAIPPTTSAPQRYLYEPNASILKAGLQDQLCHTYGISKLHPMSHLFTSEELVAPFPGRTFEIEAWSDFGKKQLKALLADIKQANLTCRNFPTSVDQLRRKLRLKEGGDTYLFATTLQDGTHAIIKGNKWF